LYRYTGAGQYVAHLGGVASAVEMLNSRVELLLRYLKVRGLYSCVCVSKPWCTAVLNSELDPVELESAAWFWWLNPWTWWNVMSWFQNVKFAFKFNVL
jgi:hypothetical protein